MFHFSVLVYIYLKENHRERKEKNSYEHAEFNTKSMNMEETKETKALWERQMQYVTPLKVTQHSDSAHCLLIPFSIPL